MELTGGTGRCLQGATLREAGLFAAPLEDLWGILLLPYAEYVQTGPAPQGRIERLLNKQLNGKK